MLKQNFKIKTFIGTAKTLSGFKFGHAYRYFADKVSEVFIEGLVAFLHAGDISEVESFRLSGLQQWLDQPFTKPPEPESFQPEFAF